ncbi:MAG TPA: hypothetical protein VMY05_09795 [Acidobacteriota bacterium]|nr:hypothetical protein [Acidobacteriota bacterium]
MKMNLSARKRLVVVLWLVAIHSILVGLSLIFIPAAAMPFFGFQVYSEGFFPVQGGVFHLVLAVAYGLGASDPGRFRGLVVLSIVAKFMATIFLFAYYLFVDRVWMVLGSGIGDCMMGSLILWACLAYYRGEQSS